MQEEREKTERLRGTIRALSHRNYRIYFFSLLVSFIGTWMQSVAQSWLIYRLTGSAWLLGFIAFIGQVPVFLLAPVGGVLADRHSRHRIILLTQALAMAQGTNNLAADWNSVIVRTGPDGSQQEVPVDVGKVLDGEIAPPIMEASDVLYVPRNGVKAAAIGVANAFVRMVTFRGLIY